MQRLHYPFWTRILGVLVVSAILIFCVLYLDVDSWMDGRAPYPYVWRDVAIVHLLCAAPLAWIVADALSRRLPGLMLVVLGTSGIAALGATHANLASPLFVYPHFDVFVRAVLALGWMLSAALIALALFGRRVSPGDRRLAVGIVGLLVLLTLPAIHVAARCRHDATRLSELIDQARIGEAYALAKTLLLLDPQGQIRQTPLTKVAEALESEVSKLEAILEEPRGPDAGTEQYLTRAQTYAMLGRTNEALDELRPLDAPKADNLRGLIFEARGEWLNGLASYQNAKAGWALRPPSHERSDGLRRATAGVAYCQRKAGRYAEAEAAYLELLALAPTADSHFLMALFYEDAQQADKARHHARKAMTFAPARYHERGEKLIDKMSVFQFGCFRVFTAEKGRR